VQTIDFLYLINKRTGHIVSPRRGRRKLENDKIARELLALEKKTWEGGTTGLPPMRKMGLEGIVVVSLGTRNVASFWGLHGDCGSIATCVIGGISDQQRRRLCLS